MRQRDLLFAAVGVAVILLAWPLVTGLPGLSSVFGDGARTISIDPVLQRAVPR
ncbi:hypothetical protein [Falsiroseomonas sp. HW251]|uniref:hypothetical protein n=1 Tax=Falsiroseomonas sp. HW251 TaxID=3390998 RepID=UPI003D31DCE6